MDIIKKLIWLCKLTTEIYAAEYYEIEVLSEDKITLRLYLPVEPHAEWQPDHPETLLVNVPLNLLTKPEEDIEKIIRWQKEYKDLCEKYFKNETELLRQLSSVTGQVYP